MRKRKSNFLASFQCDIRSQTVSTPNELDLAAQGEHVRSDIDSPSELDSIFNFRSDTAVIEARIKIDNQFHFALRAFDLPNEFVLRPEPLSFLFFRCHRHEIRQDNFSAGGDECCFEHVGVGDVMPSKLRISVRPNAPITAGFAVNNRREDRRTVKTRPAKPVNRTAIRNERSRSAIADDGVILNLRLFHYFRLRQINFLAQVPAKLRLKLTNE